MPTQSQHRTKARGNRDFLSEIDPSARSDWAVVVAFYTAVHLVEQVRAVGGEHSKNHKDRIDYLGIHHRAIAAQFYMLYSASRLSRYDSNADFYAQFANADIQAVVIDGWLAAVETYVAGLSPATP